MSIEHHLTHPAWGMDTLTSAYDAARKTASAAGTAARKTASAAGTAARKTASAAGTAASAVRKKLENMKHNANEEDESFDHAPEENKRVLSDQQVLFLQTLSDAATNMNHAIRPIKDLLEKFQADRAFDNHNETEELKLVLEEANKFIGWFNFRIIMYQQEIQAKYAQEIQAKYAQYIQEKMRRNM